MVVYANLSLISLIEYVQIPFMLHSSLFGRFTLVWLARLRIWFAVCAFFLSLLFSLSALATLCSDGSVSKELLSNFLWKVHVRGNFSSRLFYFGTKNKIKIIIELYLFLMEQIQIEAF